MDTEYKIYLDGKFSELHEEVHDIAIDVAEIKQWKKDQDEFRDNTHRRWNKFGIGIGSIAAVVATIAILI